MIILVANVAKYIIFRFVGEKLFKIVVPDIVMYVGPVEIGESGIARHAIVVLMVLLCLVVDVVVMRINCYNKYLSRGVSVLFSIQ